MELSGSYFTYSDVSSRKYGLIFANANTSRVTSLIGQIGSMIIHNNKEHKNYFVGESFEEAALTFDVEVITDDDSVLDVATCREIEKWLFRHPGYRKLYIDPSCDITGETYELVNGIQKQLYLNCRFVNPEKMESGGGIVGFKFTIECDSSMAWQDPVIFSYTLDSTGEAFNTVISVDVDTDIRDFVYPKVIITMGSSGGDIIISNVTDDAARTTSFVGLTPNIELTLKGNDVNYVSGGNYAKFSSRNFIRLLDGENKLSLYGDIIKIEFEFQNQRYI